MLPLARSRRARFSHHVLVLAAAAATATLTATPSARADEAAAAETLFREGRALMDTGRFGEACPKFAASQKLAPAVGTLLNLADCYQQNGQTASAWAHFVEAQSAAHRANRADREKLARDRAALLEPKLLRMTITVAESNPAGTIVKRDGAIIDAAVFGTAVPVDPGKHVIEADAPDRKKWSATVEASFGQTTVKVPALEEIAHETAPPPVAVKKPEAPSTTGNTQRTAGLVVLGVGVVASVVGTVFALSAKSKWADAQGNHCVGTVCDPEGVTLAGSAQTSGTLATVAFAIGITGLAGGAALYLTAPSDKNADKKTEKKNAWQIVPAVGPQTAGLRLAGAF